MKEIRLEKLEEYKVGDIIKIEDIIKPGDIVNVSGISKGRGFAGVMKRWGFHGGPRTHGQSDRERAPGSIGQGTDPGRVHKGKKMPGRYGNQKFTIRNLTILYMDANKQEITLSGPIPGSKNTLITINKVKSGDPIELITEKKEQPDKQPQKSTAEKEQSTSKKSDQKMEKNEQSTPIKSEETKDKSTKKEE